MRNVMREIQHTAVFMYRKTKRERKTKSKKKKRVGLKCEMMSVDSLNLCEIGIFRSKYYRQGFFDMGFILVVFHLLNRFFFFSFYVLFGAEKHQRAGRPVHTDCIQQ